MSMHTAFGAGVLEEPENSAVEDIPTYIFDGITMEIIYLYVSCCVFDHSLYLSHLNISIFISFGVYL